MSMSQLMSFMDLDLWPQAALVLFFGVFVLVTVRLFARGQKQAMHEAANLPFEDGTVTPGKGDAR